MNQSSCLPLMPAAVERSKTKRFAGTWLCTGTSALHLLPRADDEGTVRVGIGSKDAEDGDAVLKMDNWIPHVSIHSDLDTMLSGRTQGALSQSRKIGNQALDL